MTQSAANCMVHLSRLVLSPLHRHARGDLASPYELHRSIMRAFPAGAPPEESRVLFRVEPFYQEGSSATVLVQSRLAPDWSYLATRPGYCTAPVEQKNLAIEFQPGRHLRFRLRANPVIARKVDGADRSARGKRIPLTGDRACVEWLVRKGESAGFSLLSLPEAESDFAVRVTDEGRVLSRKAGVTVTHHSVLFDGVLVVTDLLKFSEALSGGIGPAKGFGFGLLSVSVY